MQKDVYRGWRIIKGGDMQKVFKFEIDITGDQSGERFQGSFSYSRPTIGKKRSIIQEEAVLNEGFNKDIPEILFINKSVAFLTHCIIECPQWFKDSKFGLDLEDENLLVEIINKVNSFEDKVAEELAKE